MKHKCLNCDDDTSNRFLCLYCERMTFISTMAYFLINIILSVFIDALSK